MGKGKKSLAYSLVFQNDDSTLVEDEVVTGMNKIEKALVNELNIEVR